jgi:tripartite-type tricarboxylate transporter receptor subunit TctC
VKLIHGLRPICSRPRRTTSGLVRVFVPAGGTPDIIARLIGQSLSQRLGQSVVIDNRPGV